MAQDFFSSLSNRQKEKFKDLVVDNKHELFMHCCQFLDFDDMNLQKELKQYIKGLSKNEIEQQKQLIIQKKDIKSLRKRRNSLKDGWNFLKQSNSLKNNNKTKNKIK